MRRNTRNNRSADRKKFFLVSIYCVGHSNSQSLLAFSFEQCINCSILLLGRCMVVSSLWKHSTWICACMLWTCKRSQASTAGTLACTIKCTTNSNTKQARTFSIVATQHIQVGYTFTSAKRRHPFRACSAISEIWSPASFPCKPETRSQILQKMICVEISIWDTN